MQRVIFVNLHGNGFLLKTLNLIVFKQSGAIKHKYLLDYLLTRDDIEICSYINKKGFCMSYSHAGLFPRWIDKLEHNYTLKLDGIPQDKIKVITDEKEFRKDDIIIMYNYYTTHYAFDKRPDCLIAVSHIHFNTSNAGLMQKLNPDVAFCEANFSHGSKLYDHFYSWYKKKFLVIPFVFGDRFKPIKPFAERQNKCFSTGTVTYMHNITPIYGDPCCQPARKQILDNKDELEPWVDCYNSNYSEDDKKIRTNIPVLRSLLNIYYKLFTGKQKKYFSFNMVEKFNDYKMCLIGEERMHIPGVGFVEGMACGCAYIGQTVGYYEDYGMQEGVHYIGYDGTLEDLKAKITYYQQPEHQEELERIAKTGCEFVRKNFCGPVIAEKFLNQLIEESKRLYR